MTTAMFEEAKTRIANRYSGWQPEPDRDSSRSTLKECEENPNSFREIINTRTPCKLIGGFKETEFECLPVGRTRICERSAERNETVVLKLKKIMTKLKKRQRRRKKNRIPERHSRANAIRGFHDCV